MTDIAHPEGSIVIVRHGETDWNIGRRIQGRTDIPLNETGRAQAREVAELLSDAGEWSGVIASPLGRAIDTATIITDRLGLPVPVIDPEVVERDFGTAEGMLVADAETRWPGLEVPDAESLAALAERGAAAVERRREAAPGSIVVAHGALIRAALTTLSGADAPRILNGEAWLLSPVDASGDAGAGARVAVQRLATPARQHAV